MDLSPADSWRPPDGWLTLTVIDSHAGGEPFRVVLDGLPPVEGDTMLERRRYAKEHLDHLRRMLMWEPRGHADMYGGWIGPPISADSDLSVLFLHNEGFSTMCGHGIIALTKVVLDTGILPAVEPVTTLRIDTPAGQVTTSAQVSDGRAGQVRFVNVPSFVVDLDAAVMVPELGDVLYDLAFGGAFYAFVEADGLGLDLSDPGGLIRAGRAIKRKVQDSATLVHPDHPDLGFLYGVIFVGPARDPGHHSRHVCVFADGEVDRSPTGTGVSARLAILHARGQVVLDQELEIESLVGSVFGGRVTALSEVGGRPAVVPEISGTAHIVGCSQLWVDPDDELGAGFLIR